MYVTAMRVRSLDGRVGTNAALYLHEGTELPGDAWSRPEDHLLELIATKIPGVRTREHVEVAPGGNDVESFLDVVAPDEVERRDIEIALEALAQGLAGQTRRTIRSGQVTASFCTALGTVDIEGRFKELRSRLISLLSDPEMIPSARYRPLVIEVRSDVHAWIFDLSAASRSRLIEDGVAPPHDGRLRVPIEIADEFRRAHGELYPYVAEWLTGLSRESLLRLGGVRFMDGEQVVGEWPVYAKR